MLIYLTPKSYININLAHMVSFREFIRTAANNYNDPPCALIDWRIMASFNLLKVLPNLVKDELTVSIQ